MHTTVNGKLVNLKEGSRISDLMRQLGIPSSEDLALVSGSKAQLQGKDSAVKSSSRYRSIPPIEQG